MLLRAGIDLTYSRLETHALCGGDVLAVSEGAVSCLKSSLDIDFEGLSAQVVAHFIIRETGKRTYSHHYLFYIIKLIDHASSTYINCSGSQSALRHHNTLRIYASNKFSCLNIFS